MREADWRAADGTRIVATLHGPERTGHAPVLCLPGLTRNARDFTVLAEAIAGDPLKPRTVVAVDFRGRGRSDAAPPETYRPDVEAADVVAGLDALGIAKAAVVGTSRGGIVAMILAATVGERVGPVVLNDIGPVIERGGLLAIRERMGSMLGEPVRDWAGAVSDLRATMGRSFTALSEADWLAFAHQMYREVDGRPVLDYDPALLGAFASFDPEVGYPPFWPLYEALGERRVLAIRGANSDLLSQETLHAMASALPRVETLTVPDEGHAPLLTDAPTIRRILDFLNAPAGA